MKFKPGMLVTLREPDSWIGVYIPDLSFVEEDMWVKAKGYRRNSAVWWPEG